MNVAVFGGSFNPPHVAHVLVPLLVEATHEVDRVLVVPTFRHPFAKDLAPYEDRVHMCEIAMAGVRVAEVSRVEEELGGESRTLRTLEHLAAQHPDWKMRLVIGSDILAEAPRWFGFESIRKLAPPIVLHRAGVDASPAGKMCLPEVSSTQVRAAIGRGAWCDIEEFVPRKVIAFVREKGLYGAPK